jgi:malate synthase
VTVEELRLHGRSLLFVRNVGHLMQNPAILDADGEEIFEGIMDAVITTACAIPGTDLDNPRRNSRKGSIYIVKPKQHGPDEVAFTGGDLQPTSKSSLGLPEQHHQDGCHGRGATHLGQPRRAAIAACGYRAPACSSTPASSTALATRSTPRWRPDPMVRKPRACRLSRVDAPRTRTTTWMRASPHGLPRSSAQIGKGMWAKTELMAEMLEQKIGQPKAGANTAWVPSPDRRQRCTPRTTTASTSSPCRRSCSPTAVATPSATS